MNFVFSNPLFLFGLAAGVLPVLIHRLIQRKAIPRDFSAVRLLLKSERIMARPQKLKHILLLALRVLAVVSLVLLMARPVMMPKTLLAVTQGGGKVLILDNSLSMGFREERGVRYDLARKAARQVIEAAGGQIMIIPTAPPPLGTAGPAREVRWMGPEEAVRELDAVPLSPGRGDPGAALAVAYQKFKEFQGAKEILVLSDMARGDWEKFDLAGMGSLSSEAGIHFLRVGGAERDGNFAVKEVKLAEGDLVGGMASRLEVTVMNFSDVPGSPLAQVYLGGAKMDQKRVDLKAGEEGQIFFDVFPDRPGWMDGEVRLSGDSLPGDDVFYFPLNVRDRVKVLVVDGDPGRSLKGSESYYLFQALAPGGAEGSPFLTRVITEGELAGADLRPYEAIFLLNAASPAGSKLTSFLESGKPVFLFMGDRVNPDEYNRIPLFPWRMKEIREGKGARIAAADSKSKALRFFAGSSAESLKKASIYRYYRIEGAADPLLVLDTGDPLLVRANVGKGALYFFASTANLNWTDLPLKAAYLPLVQALLKDAVGLSPDSLPASFRFGDPLKEKSPPVQVSGNPGGPGIYKLPISSGETRRGLNTPREESDLSKISPGEMQKRFGTIPINMLEYKEDFLSGGPAGKKELWPFLLSFLMVLLAVEMGVASRL